MDSKNPAGPGPARGPPPPLPPRQSSGQPVYQPYPDEPPSYESIADPEEVMMDHSWTSRDPRRTSQQSLTPSDSNPQNQRRKLLLVYIHGFMGNETSFRSFPAHVHNLLTVLLAETHVVHTKIYPRYRSKRNITFARNDFSRWLEPHESEKTDVVLLGHSMGGLISAEVVIMPPEPPASRPLKHRILGNINFDVPFLGMHPGVVKSGLASIFSAPAEPPGDRWETTGLQPAFGNNGASSSQSPIASPSPIAPADTFWGSTDPNYNPTFQNDVVLPVRKGWSNAWHFINKHSDSLGQATKQLVTSHLEFGGAMANYGELKARYTRLRALEEEDVRIRKTIATGNVAPSRVRFVNYYTASTGRPKKPKPSEQSELPSGVGSKASLELVPESAATAGASGASHSRSPSPSISLQEHQDDKIELKQPEVPSEDDDDFHSVGEDAPLTDMSHVDPTPVVDSDHDEVHDEVDDAATIDPIADRSLTTTSTLSLATSLPPVPDPPTAPPPLDTSYVQDKDTRKLMEKEHARATKAYDKAVKDRERLIKDRAKLDEKRERKAKKDGDKAAKDAGKARRKEEADDKKAAQKQEKDFSHSEREALRMESERKRMEAEGRRMRGEPDPELEPETDSLAAAAEAPTPPTSTPSPALSPPPTIRSQTASSRAESTRSKPEKPPKDRNFCSLPPADAQGERDPAWVRVFMKDVDEVGAHCGLFFVDERYEMLVGDVAERIEGWVRVGT